MSTATTVALAAATTAPRGGDAGAALWFLIMLIVVSVEGAWLFNTNPSEQAAKRSMVVVSVFGFVLAVVILVANTDFKGATSGSPLRQIGNARAAERAEKVQAIQATGAKVCYTHIDTMVPCPPSEKP